MPLNKSKIKNELTYSLLMQLKKDLEYARDALGNAYYPAVRLKLFNTAEEIMQTRVDLCKSILKLNKQQSKESP